MIDVRSFIGKDDSYGFRRRNGRAPCPAPLLDLIKCILCLLDSFIKIVARAPESHVIRV